MWKEILEWARNYNPIIWIILLIGSFILQIAPIKISPWTSLFKWIGKTIMNNACSKLDELNEKIDSLDKEITENEKDRIRWEVLSFANSCRNGHKHTKDEFQHIITLNNKYKKLLEKTHDSNGVFELDYQYIKELYAQNSQINDFLV